MTTKVKFKVGDKVKVIDTMFVSNENIREGMKAEIIDLDKQDRGAILQFEELIFGHDGSGLGKNGHCWWMKLEKIELDNQGEEKVKTRDVFENGDKVIVIDHVSNGNIKLGMRGVVRDTETVRSVGVEFKENVGGHDLNGNGKDGHGWYVDLDAVKLFCEDEEDKEEFTVVIEGKRTTVTLADGSIGTSKPIDKDEYSLEKGILIAKEKAHLVSKASQCGQILAEAEEIAKQVSELEGKLVDKANSFIGLQIEMAHHQAEVKRIGG